MPGVKAEQLTEPVAEHGEGPVWSPIWAGDSPDPFAGLRWVDMTRGDVLSLQPDGSVARRDVGTVAAMLRPRPDGGAVVATERDLRVESAAGEVERSVTLVREDGVRLNEGGTAPDGHLFAGSMAYDSTPGAGTLWRITPGLEVSVALRDVTVSNGLAWSPDGSLAYYADSPTRRVDVFSYAAGALTDRRPFVELEDGRSVPDGVTVDAAGRVWVALYDGGEVRCYAPSGELEAVVEVPVSKPTACAVLPGRIVVTTTREGLPDGAQPSAGALFTLATPDVTPLPAHPFPA